MQKVRLDHMMGRLHVLTPPFPRAFQPTTPLHSTSVTRCDKSSTVILNWSVHTHYGATSGL